MTADVNLLDTFDRTPDSPRNHGPAVVISFFAVTDEHRSDHLRVTATRSPALISGELVERYGPSTFVVEALRQSGWVEIMTFLDWEVDYAAHAAMLADSLTNRSA